MTRVSIEASAPTRIDLAGGTLDISGGDPDDVPAIRWALPSAGAHVLDVQIERDGLRIDTRDAAAAG